jgi:hypothetical protein
MKKPWKKPELVVLVRGTPEEAVLRACKGPAGSNSGLGPDSWAYNDCIHEDHPQQLCRAIGVT